MSAYFCLLLEELLSSIFQQQALYHMSWRATSNHLKSYSRVDCQNMLSGGLSHTEHSSADRLFCSVDEFQFWGRTHRHQRWGVLQKSMEWLIGMVLSGL